MFSCGRQVSEVSSLTILPATTKEHEDSLAELREAYEANFQKLRVEAKASGKEDEELRQRISQKCESQIVGQEVNAACLEVPTLCENPIMDGAYALLSQENISLRSQCAQSEIDLQLLTKEATTATEEYETLRHCISEERKKHIATSADMTLSIENVLTFSLDVARF